MRLADYHIHSHYSPDSKSDAWQICRQAIKRGISEIAITDHFDPCAMSPDCDGYDADAFFEELNAAREMFKGAVIIRAGLEVGQSGRYPENAERIIASGPYDFLLGSVHNLENDVDIAQIDFDESDPVRATHQYFMELNLCARTGLYDVLGHFDYITRYLLRQQHFVDFRPFMDIIEDTLKFVIDAGKGIEINVSGMNDGVRHTLPGGKILVLYRELGGEIITVGSDAHDFRDVGRNIRQGLRLAKQAGFAYYTTYDKSIPSFERI